MNLCIFVFVAFSAIEKYHWPLNCHEYGVHLTSNIQKETTFVSKGCFYILQHIPNLITSIRFFFFKCSGETARQFIFKFVSPCQKESRCSFSMVVFSSWSRMQAQVLTNSTFNLLTHLHVVRPRKTATLSESFFISLSYIGSYGKYQLPRTKCMSKRETIALHGVHRN